MLSECWNQWLYSLGETVGGCPLDLPLSGDFAVWAAVLPWALLLSQFLIFSGCCCFSFLLCSSHCLSQVTPSSLLGLLRAVLPQWLLHWWLALPQLPVWPCRPVPVLGRGHLDFPPGFGAFVDSSFHLPKEHGFWSS